AELADQARVGLLALAQRLEEAARAGAGDRADVGDDLVAVHADAGVADGQGAGVAVVGDLDAQVAVTGQQFGLAQRLEAQLVAGVGGIGDQLAQEDLLVRVERVGHQVQHLGHFGFELAGFGRGGGGVGGHRSVLEDGGCSLPMCEQTGGFQGRGWRRGLSAASARAGRPAAPARCAQSSRLRKRRIAAGIITPVKPTSAATDGHSSHRLAPRSITPRISRRKCVIGSTSAPHCTTCGMPAKRNMKPEIRIDGRNTKIVICIAWNCDCARVEISSPSARLATISSSAAMYTSSRLPSSGTSNIQMPRPRISVVWTTPMAAYGSTLATISSLRSSGVAISSSMLPCSRSRTIAIAVNMVMVIVRMMPISPGTMLTALRRSGL